MHKKFKNLFPLAPQKCWARKNETFKVPMARKERYFRSAIPQMARLLNEMSQKHPEKFSTL